MTDKTDANNSADEAWAEHYCAIVDDCGPTSTPSGTCGSNSTAATLLEQGTGPVSDSATAKNIMYSTTMMVSAGDALRWITGSVEEITATWIFSSRDSTTGSELERPDVPEGALGCVFVQAGKAPPLVVKDQGATGVTDSALVSELARPLQSSWRACAACVLPVAHSCVYLHASVSVIGLPFVMSSCWMLSLASRRDSSQRHGCYCCINP